MKYFNKDILSQRWIVGVSGGSDSMALLALCQQQNMDIIVAHMNYQLRESAVRDMNIVKTYCEKYQIPCHIKYQEERCTHNFQAFARKKRYAFYHELMEETKAKGVLVAHQMDDVIETYIMQKQRTSTPAYYGMKEEIMMMGCLVERPLLAYTKQELQDFCVKNQIPYGDDESNFSRKYTRNRIRMDIIQKMSYTKKQNTLQEIQERNKQQEVFIKKIQAFDATWDGSVNQLQTFDETVQQALMDMMIMKHVHQHVSQKEIKVILSSLDHNYQRKIKGQYLQVSYGKITMEKETSDYAYRIEEIEYLQTPYFEIKDHGTTIEAITLSKNDFPLMIRNVHKEDKIHLRFGTKSIHRWFIDRKIPANDRKIWPVVENAQGNIIFVPKIGCDIEHFSNNPTLFVIK